MALGNGKSIPVTCSQCAMLVDNGQALGDHVAQTGHMKSRWCAECNRLFDTKNSRQQHRRNSPKHRNRESDKTPTSTSHRPAKPVAAKKSGIMPIMSNEADINTAPVATTKAAARKKPASNKGPASTCTAPTASTSTNQTALFATPSDVRVVMPTPRVVTAKSNLPMAPDPPINKYSWASGEQQPNLLEALIARCHDEEVLKKQGYILPEMLNADYQSAAGRNTKRPVPGTRPMPAAAVNVTKRRALALDCEMVGLSGGRDELARLSVVDFLTGEVLMDQLVVPTERVTNWRTRYSGITRAAMESARRAGLTLNGWPVARAVLFALADADTVLVGHSLNHDLKVLRVAHSRVVDSQVLYAEEVFGRGQWLERGWALKRLCAEVLYVGVQVGRQGHDGLEDTLATRELVIRCLTQPDTVGNWARDARATFEEQKRIREEKRRAALEQEKAKKAAAEREKVAAPIQSVYGLDDDTDGDGCFDTMITRGMVPVEG